MIEQTEAISTERALKLVLEALELEEAQTHYPSRTLVKAITALREALTSVPDWASEAIEQPAPVAKPRKQEPVAWKDEQGNVRMTLDSGEIQSSVGYVYSVHGERIKNACIRSDIPNGTPLYTSPPASKPLTDEEIESLYEKTESVNWARSFARAIEAAHGIKGDA